MNSIKLLRAPLAALFALFTLSLSTTSWAQPEAKPGEVIVKFKATATASERQAIESDLGMTQVRRMDAIHAERGHVSRLTVDQAIARYGKHPKVEYIEPNYILHASLVPNDPSFPQLWGMQNTGQTGGAPGADIRAVSAWSQFTGSRSIIVAIIDTGMDYNHPDLAANAWVNANEIPNNWPDDDHNGLSMTCMAGTSRTTTRPIDDHGHGTHCSGTIGAVGDNGIGVAGVNWQVTRCRSSSSMPPVQVPRTQP
jgi:subtilisin family serine protease